MGKLSVKTGRQQRHLKLVAVKNFISVVSGIQGVRRANLDTITAKNTLILQIEYVVL